MTMHARHAPTFTAWLLASILVLCVSLVAAQQTFRARTDIVQLDVSVLDDRRQPIAGLTAADFTVLEEGRVRPIETFVEVNVPPPAAPPAVWARDLPQDVVSNEVPPSRILVIVIDDFGLLNSQEPGMWPVLKTRETVRRVIDSLGPQDLAGVMFSLSRRTAQSLTTDRTRLLASLESSRLFPGTTTEANEEPDAGLAQRGDCRCGLCSIDVLREAAIGLRSIAGQRKTIIYVSPGLPMVLRPMEPDCYPRQVRGLEEAFRQADLANVTIYPFDPRGLRSGATTGRAAPPDARRIDPRLDFLRNVAETTGARAIVGTNDPELHVPAVLAETRSYYLLGFRPSEASGNGGFRNVEVRVNRRDAQVRARKGFFAEAAAPTPEPAAPEVPTPDAGPTPATTTDVQAPAVRTALDAVTNPLIPRGDFPLRASAFAFADANGRPAAAIVLGVEQPGGDVARTAERVEVAARAADQFGRLIGTRRQALELTLNSGTSGTREYEIFSRLPLAPGRYEIRLGVQTQDARSASVYTHVDIPDFAGTRLEASGVVLNATPSLANGPKNAFGDLLPVLPTTRRDFSSSDQVMAFLRVYQGGGGPVPAPSARSQILDAAGAAVLDEPTALERVAFLGIGASDYRLRLPIARLEAGEHLLKVTITAGDERVERQVRFGVKR
jgi:VWFA-related protein